MVAVLGLEAAGVALMSGEKVIGTCLLPLAWMTASSGLGPCRRPSQELEVKLSRVVMSLTVSLLLSDSL